MKYAIATPRGITHIVQCIGGLVHEKAVCGFEPKHGWFDTADRPRPYLHQCARCIRWTS